MTKWEGSWVCFIKVLSILIIRKKNLQRTWDSELYIRQVRYFLTKIYFVASIIWKPLKNRVCIFFSLHSSTHSCVTDEWCKIHMKHTLMNRLSGGIVSSQKILTMEPQSARTQIPVLPFIREMSLGLLLSVPQFLCVLPSHRLCRLIKWGNKEVYTLKSESQNSAQIFLSYSP